MQPADACEPRKRRIDANSSVFGLIRGTVLDRKAFHNDPDTAKHKLARWQTSQRKGAPSTSSTPGAAAPPARTTASSSWQDLEGLGRPRVSDGHVKAFVAEKFGLAVTAICRLTGERDLNFRATAEGRSYVVKVANSSESKAQLECEHAAMIHTAHHVHGGDTALETPMPLELCGGGGTVALIVADVADEGKQPAAQYLVRMLGFIEGRMWSVAEAAGELAPDFAASLGRTAALLDGALLGFSHPAAAREHAWDLHDCQRTVRAYLPCVAAKEDRALVAHFAALHERDVAPLLRSGALPRSTVHQDLNDNNVVCDGQGRVKGVIDFGDMSLTETCNNLAVALAYAFFGHPKPLNVLAEAVRGYSELRAISAAELRALYPLACMRVCTTVVMAAHSVKLDPANAEYLTVSQAPAWEALRVLRAIDPQHAAAVALEAGGAAPLGGAELELEAPAGAKM